MEGQIQRDQQERTVNKHKTLTRKQYKVILDQQSKSLCQIITKTFKATGFLCNIPYPVLITSNDVLNETQIKTGEEINICFSDEDENKIQKKIIIDENRTTYTIGQEINITIIELRPFEDKLNNQKFLEIDEKLMIDGVKNVYEKKDIYIIYYKEGEEIVTSVGIINEIKKNNKSFILFHTCDTENGSSGSPISLYNHKVIGVHREKVGNQNFNEGTLLQYSIKEFCKKLKIKKLLRENKNSINLLNINNKKNENDKNQLTMIYLIDKEKDET